MDHEIGEIGRLWNEEDDNLENEIENLWEEFEEAYGGFDSDNLPQGNRSFDDQTGDQRTDDDDDACGVRNFEDSSCRRVLLLPGFHLQEVHSRPLLGLTLRKTPSFMSLLELRLSTPVVPAQGNQGATMAMGNVYVGSQPSSEKLKASNFPISRITIGAWQWTSSREGDLTAKLYYAKRKLVWEVLDGQLKSKMEILWSDITAIKAVMLHNQPGILHVELDKPPLFFREATPQPRKHTTWQQASDFTGGQAPRYRRHCAIFPPGVLDKHYEKLLQCDQRLHALSRKPFPSHESPYFNTPLLFDISGLSVNFSGLGPTFLPVMQQHPYPAYPPISRAAPINPTVTVNFPHRNDQREINCQLLRQTVWDERVHFPRTNVCFEEASAAPGNPGHDYHQLNVVTLNEIEKHLLRDSQIVSCDYEFPLPPQVQPMDSLFNPNPNHNHNNANSGNRYQTSDASSVGQVAMMQNANDHHNMQQPINWLPPLQGFNDLDNGDNFVPPDNNQDNGDLFSALYPNHQGAMKKY